MKIKIKISLVLLSCCLLSMVSWADKVQEGIELYKCGLTLPAKQVLLSELQKNGPEAAEICYYLGEIYSLIPRSDSALFYYRQGLAIDPAYLQNRVGEGKLMLVEEPYKAEEILSLIHISSTVRISINPPSSSEMIKVGSVWLFWQYSLKIINSVSIVERSLS